MDSLPTYKNPYLDTCVWIAAISGPPAATEQETQLAHEILTGVDAQAMKVVASTILHTELVKWPPDEAADPDQKIDEYLRRSFIEWIDLDTVTARLARQLRRDHKLKAADAIHLATAIRGRADVLLTNDHDLLAVGDSRGIPILLPYWPGPRKLLA